MRIGTVIGLVLSMAACGGVKNTDAEEEGLEQYGLVEEEIPEAEMPTDADGDGHPADTDCDDLNPDVNPHAFEVCDGIDNDCDEAIDEGLLLTYFTDEDGDGYGVDDSAVESCEPLDGMVEIGGDCDDDNPDVNPWALELCDGADNDCDGEVDGDTALNLQFWFLDEDGDGFGTMASYVEACSPPEGHVDNIEDCDDGDAEVHPHATEVCDGIDNNCDTLVDPSTAEDAGAWYADTDLDGFGDPVTQVIACDPPSGYITDSADCDDSRPLVNPDGTETCNTFDDDCDGDVDEGFDSDTYYRDADGDGRGDPMGVRVHCTRPDGYVLDSTDCDDGNYWVHPDMPELCDEYDNDCDGAVDEDIEVVTYYPDVDRDGYGDASGAPRDACIPPDGYVIDDTDCDDSSATINPGAVETCNGDDDDCDAAVDEGLPLTTFYRDEDGDGFGVPFPTTDACSPPEGFAVLDSDCNDAERLIRPGAYEMCNEIDDDCDGEIDDDCGSSPILGVYDGAECEDVAGDVDQVGTHIAVHWNQHGTWSNSSSLGFEIGDGETYHEACFPGSPWQNVAFEWTSAGTESSYVGNYSGTTWGYEATCAGSLGDGETVVGGIHIWTAGELEITKTEIWESTGRVSRVWFDVENLGGDDVTDFDLAFAVDWDIDYGPASEFNTLNDVSNEGDYEGVAAGEIATSEGPETGRSAVYGRCDAENQIVSHADAWSTDDDFVASDLEGALGDKTVHFGQRDMDIAAGSSISFGFLISVGEDVFEAVDGFVEQRSILCTGI